MSRYIRRQPEKTAKPEAGIFLSGVRNDFWSDTTSKQLTPARLAAILREAEDGNIARQCELFDKLEEDPHLAAVYNKRKRASSTKPLQLEPPDDSELARTVVDFCKNAIRRVCNFREALFHLHDATGRAFSACQTVWLPSSGGQFLVDSLEWWKQREFVLDTESPDQVRVLTDSDRTNGEPLTPYQWIVHRFKARSGTLAEAALLRSLTWAHLFKHSSWRDWVIFSEAYGMPRRLAYYPRGASDEEKRAAWLAARILGRDAAAALPEGAKLELLKAEGATNQLPFSDLIELSDRYISKLILGQTLTTEVGESGGNRALGQVHREVETDLVRADCEGLAETLRDQLITPLVRFNFGEAAPIPNVSFLVEDFEDLLARAKRDRELYEMGVDFSLRQIRSVYGLDKPVDDEDRLSKSATVAGGTTAMASEAEIRRIVELAEQKKSLLGWVA